MQSVLTIFTQLLVLKNQNTIIAVEKGSPAPDFTLFDMDGIIYMLRFWKVPGTFQISKQLTQC